MVDILFQTFTNEQAAKLMHDAYLEVQVNSINFIFVQRFLREIQSYFKEMEAMQPILGTTADTAKRIAKEAVNQLRNNKKLIKYSISMYNPYVIAPRNSQSEELLEADLGRIAIQNKFEKTKELGDVLELTFVHFVAVNLKVGHP